MNDANKGIGFYRIKQEDEEKFYIVNIYMLTYVPASQQQKTARNLDIDPGANYVVHSSFVDISRFCSDGGFDCRTRGLVLLPGGRSSFQRL